MLTSAAVSIPITTASLLCDVYARAVGIGLGRVIIRRMGALAGLRVIDCSRLIAGGVLGTFLADHGADVVKVENPRGGDPLRTWLGERGQLWWKVYARGKRSVTLNLTQPRGQQLLRRLVRDADVLIENY